MQEPAPIGDGDAGDGGTIIDATATNAAAATPLRFN
jgi:hypothetical protein